MLEPGRANLSLRRQDGGAPHLEDTVDGSRSLGTSPLRQNARPSTVAGFYFPLTEAEYDGKDLNFRALANSPNNAGRGIGGGLDWLKDQHDSPFLSATSVSPPRQWGPKYDWAYKADASPAKFVAFKETAWEREGNFPKRR